VIVNTHDEFANLDWAEMVRLVSQYHTQNFLITNQQINIISLPNGLRSGQGFKGKEKQGFFGGFFSKK
jgi:hypothetical protein